MSLAIGQDSTSLDAGTIIYEQVIDDASGDTTIFLLLADHLKDKQRGWASLGGTYEEGDTSALHTAILETYQESKTFYKKNLLMERIDPEDYVDVVKNNYRAYLLKLDAIDIKGLLAQDAPNDSSIYNERGHYVKVDLDKVLSAIENSFDKEKIVIDTAGFKRPRASTDYLYKAFVKSLELALLKKPFSDLERTQKHLRRMKNLQASDNGQIGLKPRKDAVRPLESLSSVGNLTTLKNAYILEFKKDGVLQGRLNDKIPNTHLAVRVRLTYDEFKEEVKGVVDRYFTLLQNIESNTKTLESVGINVNDLKKEVDFRIRPFIRQYSRALSDFKYEERLNLLLGQSRAGSQSIDTNIPHPCNFLLFNDRYKVEVIFYDKNGIPIEAGSEICGTCSDVKVVKSLSLNCGSCVDEPLWYLSPRIKIPIKATRFEYELRESNPTFREVQSQTLGGISRAPSQQSLDDLKSIIEDLSNLEFPTADDSAFIRKSLQLALAFESNAILEAIREMDNSAILPDTNKKDTLVYSHPAYKKLKDWVTYWLWLNKGVPSINPLKTYYAFDVDQKVALPNKVKKTIEASQLELDSLQARLDFINKLIENKNVSLQNFTEEFSREQDHVKRIVPRIKILTAAIAKTKKKIADAKALKNNRKMSDQLLYDGVFMTHTLWEKNYMRNHNALNEYMIMGAYRVEITEEEQMNVLVHNLRSTDIVNVTFAFTDATDQSVLEEQLGSVDSDDPDLDAYSDEQKVVIEAIIDELDKLKKLKSLFDGDQTKNLMKIPPVSSADNSPAFLTKEWKHERPSSFSTHVDYTITSGEGEKKKTEAKGKYRINKLFRYRIKAGVVYSELQEKDYTIDPVTNTVTSDIGNYGLNATAGIQIFLDPGGLDIRRRGLLRMEQGWFTYLGLALGDEIVQNWLIGGGKEIVSGVGLMVGVHVGQTEELNVAGGIPEINENKFTTGIYYSLLVDLSVFNQFFGLRDTANPLKKK
ncbi:MAG: hypothetical protein AAGF85_03870 [Bacteroidota bacterium]